MKNWPNFIQRLSQRVGFLQIITCLQRQKVAKNAAKCSIFANSSTPVVILQFLSNEIMTHTKSQKHCNKQELSSSANSKRVKKNIWKLAGSWSMQDHYKNLSLTFCSAFSFSSRFLVAVSRLVWVCDNSFSNCCIFFSRASTSSLAFCHSKASWSNMKKRKDAALIVAWSNLHFEGLFLSPRVSGWHSSTFLEWNPSHFPTGSSSFEDHGPLPQP